MAFPRITQLLELTNVLATLRFLRMMMQQAHQNLGWSWNDTTTADHPPVVANMCIDVGAR